MPGFARAGPSGWMPPGCGASRVAGRSAWPSGATRAPWRYSQKVGAAPRLPAHRMSHKKKHAPHIRACLIVNARSGADLDLAAALDELARHGWEVMVREKREKGEAGKLARKAAKDGYD